MTGDRGWMGREEQSIERPAMMAGGPEHPDRRPFFPGRGRRSHGTLDALRLRLCNTPQLGVKVVGRVAFLIGRATNRRERSAAIREVKATPGVRRVETGAVAV